VEETKGLDPWSDWVKEGVTSRQEAFMYWESSGSGGSVRLWRNISTCAAKKDNLSCELVSRIGSWVGRSRFHRG